MKGAKVIKQYKGEEVIITNPLFMPEPHHVEEYYEPLVIGKILFSLNYNQKLKFPAIIYIHQPRDRRTALALHTIRHRLNPLTRSIDAPPEIQDACAKMHSNRLKIFIYKNYPPNS